MYQYRFPTAQPLWGRTMGQDAAAVAPVVTQFKGLPGFVETAAVLGVSAAATWIGIRAGLKETKQLPKIAGWVGGIGAGIIGLLYLGGQTSLVTGLPKVQVVKA